jgi:hypothetical protein
MTKLRFSPVVGVLVSVAALFVVGCTSTGTTGDSTPARNTRSGGWENFRAEVTILEQAPTAVS